MINTLGCLPKHPAERYCVKTARRASRTSRKQAVTKITPPSTHYKNKRSYILCIITKKQVKILACTMVKNESNILTLLHVYGKVKVS